MDLANHGDQYALDVKAACDLCAPNQNPQILEQVVCAECLAPPKDYEVEVTLSPYAIGV